MYGLIYRKKTVTGYQHVHSSHYPTRQDRARVEKRLRQLLIERYGRIPGRIFRIDGKLPLVVVEIDGSLLSIQAPPGIDVRVINWSDYREDGGLTCASCGNDQEFSPDPEEAEDYWICEACGYQMRRDKRPICLECHLPIDTDQAISSYCGSLHERCVTRHAVHCDVCKDLE